MLARRQKLSPMDFEKTRLMHLRTGIQVADYPWRRPLLDLYSDDALWSFR